MLIDRYVNFVYSLTNLTKGNANHVSPDQLNYVVNNSKLAQPFKVPLTKTPFQSDITLLVKAAA